MSQATTPALSPLELDVACTDQVQHVPGYANDLISKPRAGGSLANTLPAPSRCDLPFELLSGIFILALSNDEDFTKDRARSVPPLTPKPFTFCAVCSWWRSVALATPQLWKRVFVRVAPGISGAEVKSKATDLVSWVERSASLPLTLFLSYGVNTSLNEERVAPIAEALNRYAARWEKLYLRYGGPRWPDPAAERKSRLFDIVGWSSLRRIYSFRKDSGPHGNETIPWAQLTHLKIHAYLPYRQAMDILKGCSKLERLSIRVDPLQPFETLTTPIVLYNLTFISLTGDHISEVMRSIRLPSLKKMHIHSMWWRRPTDLTSLLDFFTRSECILDTLEITGSPHSEDLIAVLTHESCASLTSLSITISYFEHYASITDEVLQRLTLGKDDSLCTNLKFLTLRRCIRGSFSALLDMVESRISSCAGQLPDDSELLEYFHLQIKDIDGEEEKLDGIIERSGMEYTGDREKDTHYYSVSLQRQGFEPHLPADLEDIFDI